MFTEPHPILFLFEFMDYSSSVGLHQLQSAETPPVMDPSLKACSLQLIYQPLYMWTLHLTTRILGRTTRQIYSTQHNPIRCQRRNEIPSHPIPSGPRDMSQVLFPTRVPFSRPTKTRRPVTCSTTNCRIRCGHLGVSRARNPHSRASTRLIHATPETDDQHVTHTGRTLYHLSCKGSRCSSATATKSPDRV